MSVIAFLLATVSSWATIGALRYDHSETTGPTRLKLAALILTPLLFLILGPGIPVTIVLLYYLAGFAAVYLGLYSLAILLGAHQDSTQTTGEELGEQIARELQTGGGQRHRQQRRERTRQTRTQQRRQQTRKQTSRQDDTPVVFKRQLK